LKEVPYGFQGTAQIVAEMTRLALDAYGDERINILARQITMGCPGHDKLCEADTIFRWFQDTFRYTFLPFHPKGFQRLQTPLPLCGLPPLVVVSRRGNPLEPVVVEPDPEPEPTPVEPVVEEPAV
jgi:hypothetical protein